MRIFRRRLANQRHIYEFSETLPSNHPNLHFDVRFTIEWSSAEPGSLPPGILARQVRQWAEPPARGSDVLRCAAAEQDINQVLHGNLPLRFEEAIIHSAIVATAVDERTLSTAQSMQRSKQEFELDEIRRQRMRRQLAFLREEVYSDPATARIYWLLQNPHHPNPLAQAVQLDDLVQQVSDWHSGKEWVSVAQLLHKFVEDLTKQERSDLLGLLRHVFQTHGKVDLAAQLAISSVNDAGDTAHKDEPHLVQE
jgi:hypothetical protein